MPATVVLNRILREREVAHSGQSSKSIQEAWQGEPGICRARLTQREQNIARLLLCATLNNFFFLGVIKPMEDSQKIIGITPREKMQQLALRAGICTFLFAWLAAGVHDFLIELQRGPVVLGLIVGAAAIVNGTWGIPVALTIYLISLATSKTRAVQPYDPRASRNWYIGVSVAAALFGLLMRQESSQQGPATAADAQHTTLVRSSTTQSSTIENCSALYNLGKYEQSIDRCNVAALSMAPKLSRLGGVMRSTSPSPNDVRYALDASNTMLIITSTVSFAEAKLNEKTAGRRSAEKAVGWTFIIAGAVGELDPKGADRSIQVTLASSKVTRDKLESLYPGVVRDELKAFKERTSGP